MRIAVHTPVGVFVSRILNDSEYEMAMSENGHEPMIFEGQAGQDVIICYNVLINSVIETLPDEAIRALPQFSKD